MAHHCAGPDEHRPIQDHRHVQTGPEDSISLFQLFPLLIGGVTSVEAENLVEEGEARIDDSDEGPRIRFLDEQASCCEGRQHVVGPDGVQKTVLAEDVQTFSGEKALY